MTNCSPNTAKGWWPRSKRPVLERVLVHHLSKSHSVPPLAHGTLQAEFYRFGREKLDDLIYFYRQLPNGDRQFVILPNTAHSPGYGNNRHLLWYVTRNFLAAPAAVGS